MKYLSVFSFKLLFLAEFKNTEMRILYVDIVCIIFFFNKYTHPYVSRALCRRILSNWK